MQSPDGPGGQTTPDPDSHGSDRDSTARGGTYTLVVALADPATVEVGALGPVGFDAGHYAYTGSALGPGGFARVGRHRAVARGERSTRHWHVDSLLGTPTAEVVAVVRSPGVDAECVVARSVPGRRVPGFGATDCDCPSHLVAGAEGRRLLAGVRAAHPRPVVDRFGQL